MSLNISDDARDHFVVKKSRLEGKIRVSGAKNSALKLLTASILTDEPIEIINYPSSLIDTQIHVEMLRMLGKHCRVTEDRIFISCDKELGEELQWKGPSIRNTLLIFGSLLARKGKAKVPLPGGCSIGDRDYDLHQMVLEHLGAKVWEENGCLCGEAPLGLHGSEITLPIRSTGATENAILAGSLAQGTTVVWGPHFRPEIADLIAFMRSMGADIEVHGQESIRIHGVRDLAGTRHTVIPDNMEAITFLIAAVITQGDIEIENFPYRDLEVPLIHLRESGAKFYRGEETLIVRGGRCFPVDISTGPYPGINSDMQPLFAVYALCAKGESRIIDLRFPKRFRYAEELSKLDADLSIRDNILIVKGGKQLRGNTVIALDLRCGAALLLAGLVSEGETRITNISQIERGYEHADAKLRSIGADICLFRASSSQS
ncbi:MAG: UDP-N-acetylglucosamine 1-carboxyvinyltransferase [Acidobacteria bacterium]|nr:UDP-N-acetylglucosamine 1-carboxyvinyltransferase [Acidobacteriota bacterium]